MRVQKCGSWEEIKNNLVQPEIFDNQDGRSKKKTGRTHQLATRVTFEFYRRVRMIASRDNLKIVELLEKAIDVYESQKTS